MDDKWLTDFIEESIPLWLNDPVLFFREVLEFEPDDWQVEAAHNIRTHNRVAIKSGQGVGKTAFEAGIFLWFLTCYYNARVVATAPTQQQLHDVLWSEVAKWMNNSPLLPALLKWTKTYVYVKGYEKRWFAVARTANKPENMQGFHEDNMLFIVDEASGVADPIMEAIMGTLSGDNNKLLMCGNPTKTTGTFYDAFTVDRAIFALQTVSSRDSKRTNKDNIASLDRKYGKDSNVVRVRVDGKFPEQEDDVFIPASWIEDSISTEMEKETALAFGVYVSESGEKIRDVRGVLTIDIGCDVARFGDDRTCITFKVNEVVHRTQITWWDETLNGSNALDGAAELSAELPPFFAFKYPVVVENGNEIAFPKIKYRAGVQHEMQAEIFPVHRVLLNWWEGYGTLDGMTDLDGSLLLDHTMPPVIKETYRMDIGTQEDIGVNLFIPAHAKPLNGDFALDGTINLNSGREEL